MPRRNRNTGCKVPYRLRREARTADFPWMNNLSEEEAYELFKEARWRANGGNPYCPACGSVRYYTVKCRDGWWKCREKTCRKMYSVTSGTVFHSRKLPFLKLVKMLFQFTGAVKGISALQMSFIIDCQYKTAFVNLHKAREAMASHRETISLEGEVELDAAYYGGKEKQANLKKNRVDRRRAKQDPKQRVIMVLRQRYGKTIAFAANSETQAVVNAAVRAIVPKDAETIFYSDGHVAYEDLEAFGELRAGDHGQGFVFNGASTNLAESFHSRARRGEFGSYHHLSPTWLELYAGEMCWRENRRRTGNKEAMMDLLRLAMDYPVSRCLKGYWQHWQLPDDQLERQELRWGRVFEPMFAAMPPRNYRLIA